jgi:hypothetical protein
MSRRTYIPPVVIRAQSETAQAAIDAQTKLNVDRLHNEMASFIRGRDPDLVFKVLVSHMIKIVKHWNPVFDDERAINAVIIILDEAKAEWLKKNGRT